MPRRSPARPRPRPRAGRPTASQARRPAASAAPRIRVVVSDHQSIDRAGIVGLLAREPDLEVVGEAATVDDTVRLCHAREPDVLVLSLNLPAQDRDAAIPAIRERLPGLRILALSERGSDNCLVLNPPSRRWLAGVPLGTCPVGIDCLQLAAQQGCMATLRRSADPAELFRAIRDVARGQASYDPTTAAGILSITGSDRGRAAAVRRLFSDREAQVAALIAEGMSNKDIANRLGIGAPTVKKHVGHVLEKLGLQDRLQAGLFLARNPLLLNR